MMLMVTFEALKVGGTTRLIYELGLLGLPVNHHELQNAAEASSHFVV